MNKFQDPKITLNCVPETQSASVTAQKEYRICILNIHTVNRPKRTCLKEHVWRESLIMIKIYDST